MLGDSVSLLPVGTFDSKDARNLVIRAFFHTPNTQAMRINFKQTATHVTRTSVREIGFRCSGWQMRPNRNAIALSDGSRDGRDMTGDERVGE